MTDAALCFLTMYDLAERIRTRQVSPVEVVRFGFCPDLHFGELDDVVATGLEDVGRSLQDLGANLETVPFALKDIVDETRQAIYMGEFGALHRERFRQHPEGYGADVRDTLQNRTNGRIF